MMDFTTFGDHDIKSLKQSLQKKKSKKIVIIIVKYEESLFTGNSFNYKIKLNTVTRTKLLNFQILI